ncbi:MAG TPA: hypothetical protein VEZ12_15980, partial [Herpetosiphonaceae bacterium]|nr:hypothetical protein [Herpetosiphonaceae bacterium]
MTGAVADGEFSSKHYSQVSKIEADRSKGEADRAVTEANRSASEANRAETAKASADASVATIATHAAEAKTARDSSAQSAQQSAQSAGQAGSGPASKLYYDLLNKVVVSATGVVDTFVYDTTLDDDRGQWIYKCGWTTYFNEPLNVANVRGGRREHPVVAGIVLRAGRLDILDLQDLDTATGTPRLWKSIFPAAGPHAGAELWRQAQRAGKCVWARNGLLLWGIDIGSAEDGASGLCYIDWSIDEFGRYPGTSAAAGGRAKGIINATVANGHILDDSLPVIVSSQVHDVHAEVLPGAPLNAAGLPIPHIVVGTQSGFSVILPNGTVWDMTGSTAWSVRLLKDGTIRAAVGGTGIVRDYAMLTADILSTQHQTEWNPIANFPRPLGGWVGVVSDDAIGNKSSSAGLTFLAKAADKASSMVSYATINYVTGWQPGDIRLAALGEGAVGNVSDYPELVSNGSAFADTAGWSSDANTTLTASPTGNLVISVASGSGFAWTTIPTVAGKAYRVSFDLVTGSGFFRVGVGAHTDGSLIPAGSIGSAGRKIYSFVASGPTSYLTFSVSGTNASMAIDNVSVKEDVVVNGTFDRDLTSWRLFTGTDGSITWSGGAALLVSTASSTVYIRQTLTTIPG